jgi:hypothetical protein
MVVGLREARAQDAECIHERAAMATGSRWPTFIVDLRHLGGALRYPRGGLGYCVRCACNRAARIRAGGADQWAAVMLRVRAMAGRTISCQVDRLRTYWPLITAVDVAWTDETSCILWREGSRLAQLLGGMPTPARVISHATADCDEIRCAAAENFLCVLPVFDLPTAIVTMSASSRIAAEKGT